MYLAELLFLCMSLSVTVSGADCFTVSHSCISPDFGRRSSIHKVYGNSVGPLLDVGGAYLARHVFRPAGLGMLGIL